VSAGHKKKTKKISTSLTKKLKIHSRIQVVESQIKSMLESKSQEAHFQASMMFGLNGLVEALVEKNVVTMDDIERSRFKVMADYRAERVEQLKASKTAEKYNNCPVHYDSTTDKWFVFAPNWKDKLGPFLSQEAAETARKQIEDPRTVSTPVNQEVES